MESLNFMMILADIESSVDSLVRYKSRNGTLYNKMLCCYHIQQAFEKLIKIQMYLLNSTIPAKEVRTHSLTQLFKVAYKYKIPLMCDSYLKKRKDVISAWEAEGRYMEYVKYRIDMVENCLKHVMDLFNRVSWYYSHKRVDFTVYSYCFNRKKV